MTVTREDIQRTAERAAADAEQYLQQSNEKSLREVNLVVLAQKVAEASNPYFDEYGSMPIPLLYIYITAFVGSCMLLISERAN